MAESVRDGGIRSFEMPEVEWDMRDRARPPEHSRVCWASAIGAACHDKPFLPPDEIPAVAVAILASRPDACKCRGHARNVGIRGARQRT